jgi:hypothetical protein
LCLDLTPLSKTRSDKNADIQERARRSKVVG